MANFVSAAFVDLVKDITQAASSSNGPLGETQSRSIKADLNSLCEQILDALENDKRSDAVADAYAELDKGYSALAIKEERDTATYDRWTTAIELRALSRLLGTVLKYRQSLDPGKAVRDDNFRPLLDALVEEQTGLSGRDLAKKLQVTPETIARKLPELRSLGLVVSQQVGKQMNNRLTTQAQTLLAEARAQDIQRQQEVSDDDAIARRFVFEWSGNHGKDSFAKYLAAGLTPYLFGKVIAKRAIRISGKTVNMDAPVGVSPFSSDLMADLTVKHGKVSPSTGMTFEVVSSGTAAIPETVTQALISESLAKTMCWMGAQEDAPGNMQVVFQFDRSNRKITANILGEFDKAVAG